MRFQKGQVVKVRDDLCTMAVDGVFNLWTDMCKFAGEDVVISEAKETPWGDRYEIVGSPRCWTEECFVPVKEVEQVHRAAEDGEYVIIVDAKPSKYQQGYRNGEVFKVNRADIPCNGDIEVEEINGIIEKFEYDVLENYYVKEKKLADFTNKEISEELLRRFS